MVVEEGVNLPGKIDEQVRQLLELGVIEPSESA